MTTGFCCRCKKVVEMKDDKIFLNKKKMRMSVGRCPACDTKVCKILGK